MAALNPKLSKKFPIVGNKALYSPWYPEHLSFVTLEAAGINLFVLPT